ncbi:hypothetical protein NDU88_003435 [Pleurodeles waltl]|uniref:Uncharacterized protein n=1 Tax=Pleurodeles waltl TaxID=8319 RepID=A0AAV7VFS3_PLEWA|nr:hypothetical protein NDU88_003435 [Pleurodeles waltl]
MSLTRTSFSSVLTLLKERRKYRRHFLTDNTSGMSLTQTSFSYGPAHGFRHLATRLASSLLLSPPVPHAAPGIMPHSQHFSFPASHAAADQHAK